jgi:carboxyl-terminal processing protease
MPSSKINFRALALWLLIGGLIGWQANTFLIDNNVDENVSADVQLTSEDMDLFWDVWDEVQDDYIDIDSVDEDEQIYGAISGMVDALDDPYSVFMDPEETDEFHVNLDGELEGIGAELTVRDGKLVVIAPLKNSPAEEAGILPGDQIVLVDGESAGEMTIWDAIMKIRGEKGTEVILTVLHDGDEETTEVTIIRDEIEIPSIEISFEDYSGDAGDSTIALVSIYQFSDDTYSEFRDAIREINLEDVDGLVVDLRRNGGGYLDESVEIIGEFFEDQVKSVIVKRRDTEDEIIYTDGKGDLTDLPLAVLIDEGSASASEILAGAIQDHERGVVIGEQSFGKGSVQELKVLSEGASLRLTIAKWYTPDDRTIHDLGITPDILVEMDEIALSIEEDIQLQAAFEYLSEL